MSPTTSCRKGADNRIHVQTGTSAPPDSSPVFAFRFLRRWWFCSRLRVLLSELGNLTCRIRWALEIRAWEYSGCKGPLPSLYQLSAAPESSSRKRAYILYMQRISARHPSLTVIDHNLILQAWKDGWESCVREDIRSGQSGLDSSAYPEVSHSSSASEVQQSTKHDPSTPLPSPE